MTRDESVERGKARRRLGLEIGEDVVLDDRQVVRGGALEQPVRRRAATSVAPVGLCSAELVM